MSPKTLARWTISMLDLAGVDTSIWKSHACRSASALHHRTSRQLSCIEVHKLADWSLAGNIFKKFYEEIFVNICDLFVATVILYFFMLTMSAILECNKLLKFIFAPCPFLTLCFIACRLLSSWGKFRLYNQPIVER